MFSRTSSMWWHGPNHNRSIANLSEYVPVRPTPAPMTRMLCSPERAEERLGAAAAPPAEKEETPQRPEDEPDDRRAQGNSIPELQRPGHRLVPDEGDQSAQ